MWQPILILSPFVWGPPRMQGLRSISALFWAPEKVGVWQPLLILSPENPLNPLNPPLLRILNPKKTKKLTCQEN